MKNKRPQGLGKQKFIVIDFNTNLLRYRRNVNSLYNRQINLSHYHEGAGAKFLWVFEAGSSRKLTSC